MDASTNPENQNPPQPDEPQGFVARIGVSETVQVELDPPAPPTTTYTANQVREIFARAVEVALTEFGVGS